jgi:hypothetical protein
MADPVLNERRRLTGRQRMPSELLQNISGRHNLMREVSHRKFLNKLEKSRREIAEIGKCGALELR